MHASSTINVSFHLIYNELLRVIFSFWLLPLKKEDSNKAEIGQATKDLASGHTDSDSDNEHAGLLSNSYSPDYSVNT